MEDPDFSRASEGQALMLAAERGATRSIRSWQKRGGDINLTLSHAGSVMTPLQTAAHAGYDVAVRTLLDCGADADRTPVGSGHVGYKPLQLAARGGHTAAVLALLEAGANPKGADDFGQTALHYAAAFGHADCCMELLRYGSDPTARDATGHRPDSLASAAGHTQLSG
jgi:cytohesin